MAEFFDNAVRKPLLAYVPSWIKPNHLTVLRAVLLGPLILAESYPALAVGIVIFSAVCDLLDGALARVRGEHTKLGAWLDPAADKVFILGALIFVIWSRVPPLIGFSIIGFDVVLTGIRVVKDRLGIPTNANQWGGIKVWFQSFGICFILTGNAVLGTLATPTLVFAAGFAFLSLAIHVEDILASPR